VNNYLNQVAIPKGKSGSYAIEHFVHPANEPMDFGVMRSALIGGQKVERVTFDAPTTWHRLVYGGGVWMTDLPIEQQQTRDCLKGFSGNVLVGGLGIGLAANWLASRPEVKSVTVIELSKEVIELVEPHLIDPEKKIKVVKADLLKWLKNRPVTKKTVFDWAFYDIWQSDGEGTFFQTVVPLRKLSVPFVPDERVVCWNEDVMRGQLAFGLHSRYLFATNPPPLPPGSKAVSPSLKDLAHPKEKNIWIDWSVLFFQAVERGAITEANRVDMIQFYAGSYGRPGFEEDWKRATKGGKR
jgi:hypothetical protein